MPNQRSYIKKAPQPLLHYPITIGINTLYFLLFICILAAFYSCKKRRPYLPANDPKEIIKTKPPVDSTAILDSIRKANAAPQVDSSKIKTILLLGSGTGDLIIDGTNLIKDGKPADVQKIDTIKIKGGSYNSITIKNISVPDGKRVLIVNDGLITLNGDFKAMYLSELNNVTISGNGSTGNDRGFAFINNKFRAVVMEGRINNFTLQNMLFKNVNDYVIFYNGLDKKTYAGSSDSYVKNLAFLNLDGDNIGPLLQLPGEIETARFTGLIKGIEVAGITCINSPDIGAVVFLGNCEDYNVHDNFINNVNAQNNNHNGIFMLRGNGKFYNNMVKNHQGNAIRAWTYSVDATKTVEIFNNIVYNSRKYSAFELQVPPYIKKSSLFKPANAKVYNNTVGKMNTEKSSFPGRVLDLYNTWGTLEFYNNLCFDDNDNILLNNMSDVNIIKDINNIYKSTYNDAVDDNNNFVSKFSGASAVR